MIRMAEAAEWIEKLSNILFSQKEKREFEINKLAKELLFVPRDLVPVFIEPDLQPFSPADEYSEENDVFRTPFYGWMEKFLNSKKDQNDGRRQLFILGDAGMGKTSVLAMFKLAHINSFFGKDYACEAMKLGSDTIVKIRDIKNPHKTLLLLDSLDEDIETYFGIKQRILELLKATENFFRVVITCRTQFFPVTDDPTFVRQDQVKIGPYKCPVIFLSLFRDKQVVTYLNKKFKEDTRKVVKAKQVVTQMGDLKFRPLLLTYIDDLMYEDNLRNPFQIYNVLVDSWLDRECRKPTVALNKDDLLNICIRIATIMTKEGTRKISEDRLDLILNSREDIEGIHHIDVGGRSLLNRNSDRDYLFAHQSFQEFLVVLLLKSNVNTNWDLPNASEMIATFMRSTDMSGVSINEANLTGANLRGIILQNANLVNSNLYHADFNGGDLTESDLSEALLKGANFNNAKLIKTNLDHADLTKASLIYADLEGASLQKADLTETQLGGASLKGANLKETILRQAHFTAQTLDGPKVTTTFECANLTRTELAYTNLAGVDFTGANLREANLNGANLTGAKLTNANLEGADLTGAYLTDADLKDANFRFTNLNGAWLEKANFEGANFENVKLDGAKFERVSLAGAKLTEKDRIKYKLFNNQTSYSKLD